jgi:hypothetical protein
MLVRRAGDLDAGSGDTDRPPRRAELAKIASCDPDGAGLYVTNEVFLYRIIGISTSDLGEMVELEDCYMLDVVRVPIDVFHERRLRVVTAVPADA